MTAIAIVLLIVGFIAVNALGDVWETGAVFGVSRDEQRRAGRRYYVALAMLVVAALAVLMMI